MSGVVCWIAIERQLPEFEGFHHYRGDEATAKFFLCHGADYTDEISLVERREYRLMRLPQFHFFQPLECTCRLFDRRMQLTQPLRQFQKGFCFEPWVEQAVVIIVRQRESSISV